MAKIEIDNKKMWESLIKSSTDLKNGGCLTLVTHIQTALKEQGFEFKDGKIVPVHDILKESEDEKIRKELLNMFNVNGSWHGIDYKTIHNWLEKQSEQKPVELFDIPENGIENDVSVTSRMEHVPEHLKSIAKFILEYAHWNLHKDEWNHPVPEVPLFRVLDALVQEGKPYQGCVSCVVQKPVDATPTNEDEVRKKVKEIFDFCEKIDISEMEKNRAAFGLLELEAFADIFYKIGKEQKQTEWSEEDINMIDWLIRCCEKEHEELCNDRYGHQDIVSDLKRDCRKKWDWLESLKEKVAPQKQWKPSEEQIKAINHAIQVFAQSPYMNENDYLFNMFKGLKKDLEQLKAL